MSVRRNYTVYRKRRITADGKPVKKKSESKGPRLNQGNPETLLQAGALGQDPPEPVQEVLPGVDVLKGPEDGDEVTYKSPKYPPMHGGKNWVKPRSWGEIVSHPLVLVAFPEQWLPGTPETTLKDLALSPQGITVRMENGSRVTVENLLSVRVVGKKRDELKRSLHMG